jgi:hypothetical protein
MAGVVEREQIDQIAETWAIGSACYWAFRRADR